MTSENKRDLPVNITFAPIIPLGQYRMLLEKSGLDPERIEKKISAITEQRVTNIFYLPSGAGLDYEYIYIQAINSFLSI